MTSLEYDLHKSVEYTYYGDGIVITDVDLDFEKTAENLSKIGYQKIVWHNSLNELPDKNIYVFGYDSENKDFAIVRFDGKRWFTDCFDDFKVDYWTNIPDINIRR